MSRHLTPLWFFQLTLIPVLFFAILAKPVYGASYNIYDEGTIGSTYRDYFAGVMADKPDHYIAFRSGAYTYILAYGDLALNGSTISGSATVVTYTATSGYQGIPSVTSSRDDSFSVSVGSSIVYTDLIADRPILNEGGKSYDIEVLAIAVAVLFVFVIIHDIYYFWRYSRR